MIIIICNEYPHPHQSYLPDTALLPKLDWRAQNGVCARQFEDDLVDLS